MEDRVKRLVDVLLSSTAVLVSSPLLLLCSFCVLVSSPGPILFTQTRLGRNGKKFKIYKFRTMSVNHNRQTGQTTNNDPEVFMIGRYFRRFKIDELPQLLNVLFGDMSIVGPRPCLEETLLSMPDWAKKRFDVKPGLTGLAQVNGNITLSWPERWKFDVLYVENRTLYMDARILVKTGLIVLFGEEKFRRAK